MAARVSRRTSRTLEVYVAEVAEVAALNGANPDLTATRFSLVTQR